MTFPKTMRAAILTELRNPLVVDEVELPHKLDVGQVLVKIHYSGICGSQLGEIDGVKGEDKFLPHLLGHEGSGRVLAIGPGVRYVSGGDTVVLHWRKGQGIEASPPAYRWRGNKLNAGWVTTLNEYAIVAENRLTAIPADSDLQIAALFGCAVTTGFGVIENNAQVRIGESVVVFGAGGIGLNMIQAAALVSAYPIIAVDRFDSRLELAKQFGADYTVNSFAVEPFQEIRHILGNRKLDVFIDNTGNPRIIQEGYKIIKVDGKLVLVGVPKKEDEIKIYSLPMHFGKTIIGSHGGGAEPQTDIPRLLNIHLERGLGLSRLITKRFGIEDVNDALSGMKDGSVTGRCLIEF